MHDYTNDQRGDVGSWVRATTLRSLTSLVPSLLDGSNPFTLVLTQTQLDTLIGTFAKLALERIDTVREAAGLGLLELARIETNGEKLIMKGKDLLSGALSE